MAFCKQAIEVLGGQEMITVIGLGNKGDDLTIGQVKAISNADKVVVKTALDSTYTYFKENNIKIDCLDYILEKATKPIDIDTQIVEYLLSLKENKIVYCVSGSGYIDTSVLALQRVADIALMAGVACEAQALSSISSLSYTVYSASDFLDKTRYTIDTNLPLAIFNVYDNFIARELKARLLGLYPDSVEVIITGSGKTKKITLLELDKQKDYGYSCVVCVMPKLFLDKSIYTFGDTIDIVKQLRAPNGCPWDREQTLASIRGNIIEEAYELVEAINLQDIGKITEECGDVLLQSVFCAVMAQESQQFNILDVTSTLAKKLIQRHTHIFGKDKAVDALEALDFWEQAKKKEKSQKSFNDVLASVAKTFNALLRAEKIQKIIKKTGFDFSSITEGYNKVYEELEELKEAHTPEEIENECGDLLFSAVNLLRLLGVSPEVALDKTTDKFIRRFDYVVQQAEKEGYDIYSCPFEKMEEWYQQGKAEQGL